MAAPAHPADGTPGITPSGLVVDPARVVWDGTRCLSADHGDRYFSEDGPGEVERVFITPCELRDRFSRLPSTTPSTFTCGELGFGSGLNVAALTEAFLSHAPERARLHIISFERAPLAHSDFERVARAQRATLPAYAELSAQYPPRLSGWHRRHLAKDRVTLSLYFGDAAEGLRDIATRQRRPVDHWLLDGFAPAKNPSLWQDSLFEQLAALSTAGSTVATYTAVGNVRRALQRVGFAMRRVDQMPRKLHSLAGEFAPHGLSQPHTLPHVQILGAGIAGANLARSLAERGCRVSLIEPGARVARFASRIPAAVLHGRLRTDDSPGAAWQALSYHYSHHRLRSFTGYKPNAPRQISGPNAAPERLAALLDRYAPSGDWLESLAQPSTRWRDAAAALQFRIGGVVHGPTLCRSLVEHPQIELTDVRASAEVTVLCNGLQSRDTPAASYLEIAALNGQAELCAHPSPPQEPIVGAGYLAPCAGGMVIGATYEYKDWSPQDAIAANLAPWRDHGRYRGSFRAARTITSDRVAIVGALFAEDGAQAEGLRVCTGFGSTGMSSAPLAAECIAAELTGEFEPLTTELTEALSSRRFRSRQARRGPRMGATP